MTHPPSAPPKPPNSVGFTGYLPKRSAGLKLLLVCGLALLMVIPAMLVHGIVYERNSGLDTAISDVSERVGGQQAILGPVLAVPYSHAPDPGKPDSIVYGIAIAFAETGSVQADVFVEERQRGLYSVPVFDASVSMQAMLNPADLRAAIPANAEAIWSDARLYVGISDTRGIKEAISVIVDGDPVFMEPISQVSTTGGYSMVPYAGVTLAGGKLDALPSRENMLDVSVSMQLSGAQRFAIGPFAKDTDVTLTSNWLSPSFTGGVLPTAHTVGESDAGFTAKWRVPYLARGIAGAGANLDLSKVTNWGYRDMAVNFIKEVSPYQSVERALKYAAMFVGFVFLAYFLFEITSGARAHPAQYVLVGLAQTIFYLLLLAFSERIGFDLAFMIAAVMTVILTASYAMSVFKSRQYGLRALGILSGIYGLIYVLMRAENHALLAGALASFAAIGLTMYMTRNVDWYGDQEAA